MSAHHWQFASRLSDFHKVREWLDNALEGVFEAEMRALAKRFPRRRIELHSGMGVTQVIIKKRGNNPTHEFGEFSYSNHGENFAWPFNIEEPAPDLWAAIRTYQDEVSDGKDPGLGTIIYENGKRLSGLPAGGA